MTIDQKFKKYHKDNPRVYDLIVKYSNKVRAAGFKHYGIWAIINQVRWHVDVETQDPDGFKMNNNYCSRYARMVMDNHPHLDGLFRLRQLKEA